jgi:small ligand-binding sensory domain FIST
VNKDPHCITGHWTGNYSDVEGFGAWARKLVAEKGDSGWKPDLAMIFWTPGYFDSSADLAEELQLTLRISNVIGCSSTTLILDDREYEGEEGVTVSLHSLPNTTVSSMAIESQDVSRAVDGSWWKNNSPFNGEETNSFVAFVDPASFDVEGWLRGWEAAFPERPVFGGLAVGGSQQEIRTQLYLNGRMKESGAVVVGLEGDVFLQGITSQGCLPIGEPRPITRSRSNVIEQIGNLPAFKVLADTLKQLSPEEQQKLQGNLFMGLAFNEYQESFKEGDFLIRNLVEADPVSGNLAVAANLRLGQTIQFQKRDPSTASRELHTLLGRLKASIEGCQTHGALLCSCLGRGSGLFTMENHDASVVSQYLGAIGVNGFFANGEIGPVAGRNFVHGYTATLGVFCSRMPGAEYNSI